MNHSDEKSTLGEKTSDEKYVSTAHTAEPPLPVRPRPTGFLKWLPLIITLLWAGWYSGKLRVPNDSEWAIPEFGRIPIVVEGRHMPMDSAARTVLMQLRNRQVANLEPWKDTLDGPKVISATEWGLDVMLRPEVADTYRVIRIDSPDIRGFFGLSPEADPAKQNDGKHYSWVQLQPRWEEFEAEVRRISSRNPEVRTVYEEAMLRLARAASDYRKFKLTFGPAATGDLKTAVADYKTRIEAWRTAFKASFNQQDFDRAAYGWGEEQRTSAPLIAPRKGAVAAPPGSGVTLAWCAAAFVIIAAVARRKRWISYPSVSLAVILGVLAYMNTQASPGESIWATPFEEVLALERGETAPTLDNYAAMASAYRSGDKAGFAAAVKTHLEMVKAKEGFATDVKKASREQLLSFAAPFYFGMYIAVAACLFAIAYWFSPEKLDWARRTAVQMMVLTLIIETVGLIVRYMIEGRPPVTTLYTSAIFIGWAVAIFGLILERVYPFSIGVVVAGILGFCSMFIAHNLHIKDGSTFKVLQPVLDTNFWLATHVVIVTLGYAATYFAGVLAIIYIIRSATRSISSDIARALTRMVYAVICFATLFSFVGTVLGGLWADQSWGRFWGWDVKENGALMIVIWNAVLLHARWGGLVRERGLMCLALGGNIITSWSWFGVNNLKVGLHSYGFTEGAAIALIAFAASQLILMGIAMVACPSKVDDNKPSNPPVTGASAATA